MLARYWLCLSLLNTVGCQGKIAEIMQPQPRRTGQLQRIFWLSRRVKRVIVLRRIAWLVEGLAEVGEQLLDALAGASVALDLAVPATGCGVEGERLVDLSPGAAGALGALCGLAYALVRQVSSRV